MIFRSTAQVAETLRKLNGKKIKMLVALVTDGGIFGLSGRYRSRRRPTSTRRPLKS